MQATKTTTRASDADLAAVVSEILGDLAFMIGDDDDVHSNVPSDAVWLTGEIAYDGPTSGKLYCWCTREFAVQLAANLLGLDPEEDDALDNASDAVCEFMNVLCGHLLTTWHGTKPVFDVTIPTVGECTETPNPTCSQAGCRCQLWVSGEPFFCVREPGDE